MAKKSKGPIAIEINEPKPSTPLAKLREKLRDLEDLHRAATPDAGYGPANVKAPKEVERAADKVSAHVDGVLAAAKDALNCKSDSYSDKVSAEVAKRMRK